MKSILTAALVCVAPLAAAAQPLVVNDIYQGKEAAGTYGDTATEDTPPVFAYPSDDNFCPEGLMPVQLGMQISCGTPNAHATSADWNRHPVVRRGWDYGSKSPNY